MTEEEKKAIEVLEKYKFSEREEYLENNAKKIGKKYEDLYLERTWIPTTYERKQFTIVYNLIEKLQKENENLKIDLEKANASIVDQTDKDNEIEHLENLLRGNLYDGYLYYKDIAREYQKNYALIEELKNKVDKRNNELIELEETSEKEFLTKQEVNENYIPKDKIREKLEKIEKEKEQYYAAGQHLMYMLLKNQLKSLLEEE